MADEKNRPVVYKHLCLIGEVEVWIEHFLDERKQEAVDIRIRQVVSTNEEEEPQK